MTRIRAISKVVPMTGLGIVLMFGATVPAVAGNVSASITDTGSSVGIGTTTPGSFNLYVAAPTQTTAFGSTINGTRSLLQFYAKDGGGVLQGRMLGYDPIKQNIVLDAGGDGTANNVVINNVGNVGIGTAKPGTKLQVVGSIRAGAGLTGIQRVLTISDTGNNTAVGLAATGTSGRNWNLAATDAASSGNLGGNPGAFMIYDGTADATRVTIDSAGNVGIGTRTPAAKLNVEGPYPQLILNNPSAGAGDQILFRNAGTAAGFIGHQNSAAKLQFSSKDASVAHMTIDDNGNVGIGTTGPDSVLHVAKANANAGTVAHFQNTGGGSATMTLKIGEGTPEYQWGEIAHHGVDNSFRIRNINGNGATRGNLLLNWDGGNVGIGTTSPGVKLHLGGVGDQEFMRVDQGNGYTHGLRNYMSGTNSYLAFDIASGVGTRTNSVLVLQGSGNVGIGTTEPSGKLHVIGGNSGGAGNGNQVVRFEDTVGSGLAIDMGGVNNSYGWIRAQTVGVGERNLVLQPLGGNVGIGTTSPGVKLHLGGVGDQEFMRVDQGNGYTHGLRNYMSGTNSYLAFDIASGVGTRTNSVLALQGSGNVGVGTTGPQDKLDVEGGSIVVNRYAGHSASGLYLSSAIGPTHYNWMITAQDRVSDALEFGPSTAPGVTTWAEPVMVIHQSGNISIGVRDPGAYRLAVKGKIRAEEVVVDTGWADFVFKKDYDLMPLEKVAKHIEEAGHLPGIPTEKEVQENGISIGQIQSKLLQKIEEMTLYVIELKKENDQLKDRISALEKSM